MKCTHEPERLCTKPRDHRRGGEGRRRCSDVAELGDREVVQPGFEVVAVRFESPWTLALQLAAADEHVARAARSQSRRESGQRRHDGKLGEFKSSASRCMDVVREKDSGTFLTSRSTALLPMACSRRSPARTSSLFGIPVAVGAGLLACTRGRIASRWTVGVRSARGVRWTLPAP